MQENFKQRNQIFIISILVVIILILVIWIIQVIPRHNSKVSILNPNSISDFSDTNIENLENNFLNFMERYYPNQLQDNSHFTILIRPNTVKIQENNDQTKTASFIIDIEETNMTFNTTINLSSKNSNTSFACPEISLMRQPNQYCLSEDYYSSIDITLSPYLPYTGATKQGDSFTISYGQAIGRDGPTVQIHSPKCAGSDSDFISAAQLWVSSLDIKIDANKFPYQVIYDCSKE